MDIYITKFKCLPCWSQGGQKGANMTETTSYEEQILKYLKRYGCITDIKARDAIGTTRCSEYIRRLREKGFMIETEWRTGRNRYGRKVRYGVYRYAKQ